MIDLYVNVLLQLLKQYNLKDVNIQVKDTVG